MSTLSDSTIEHISPSRCLKKMSEVKRHRGNDFLKMIKSCQKLTWHVSWVQRKRRQLLQRKLSMFRN